jgi:uncharacterized protein (TIGR02996 family)
MPTDEQRAFWAAIREAPEDDAPRLVYADWLEDHGDPERAEFIRVQCALAKLGPDRRKGRKERVPLEAREKALLEAHRDRWLAPLREVLRGSNHPLYDEDDWLNDLELRRGFADGQHFTLEAARRLAAAGDELEPVDRVKVAECGMLYRHKSVKEIARWPGAGCVLMLSVANGTDRDVAAIVKSPYLRNLERLGLWVGLVTDEGVRRLAAWPLGVALRGLDLKDNNGITDAGATALAESPYLRPPFLLQLHGTRIGPDGKKRLRERFGEGLHL